MSIFIVFSIPLRNTIKIQQTLLPHVPFYRIGRMIYRKYKKHGLIIVILPLLLIEIKIV